MNRKIYNFEETHILAVDRKGPGVPFMYIGLFGPNDEALYELNDSNAVKEASEEGVNLRSRDSIHSSLYIMYALEFHH